MEWPHAAHAIPGVFFKRWLAFPFVALHEAWDEEFFRQRRELHTACLAVADGLAVIVEFHYFDNGPRLRSVVADFVAIGRSDWLAGGQAHQRVAVSGRHVN